MRLDDFVLYLDENLDNCKPILEALAAHGVKVERHQTHFARGTADDEWLPFVGENGWIVLNERQEESIQRMGTISGNEIPCSRAVFCLGKHVRIGDGTSDGDSFAESSKGL